ncbi:4'-demethylrebeccamycin synthase [Amycolatopsis sp. CA-230715]|nr:4'-demethylrebeccamycin synthase [Amycolatopsis sp. CA-230715]
MIISRRGPILFASEAHAGPITPLLAIAGELGSRGGAGLWFASTDDREADVERLPGVGFASLGEPRPDLSPANWDDATYNRVNSASRLGSFAAFLRQFFDPAHVLGMYQRALALIDEIEPSLMVIDSNCVGAMDAAMTRGVPYVMNSAPHVSHLYPERLPRHFPAVHSGLPLPMTPGQRLVNSTFKVLRLGVLLNPATIGDSVRYVRRRRALGLRNPSGLSSRFADSAAAVIGNTLFGIEYPFPVPDNVRMLGPMVPSGGAGLASHPGLAGWLAERSPVVYVGFGTTMRLSPAGLAKVLGTMAAFRGRYRFLWSLNAAQQSLLPEAPPDNVRLATWVPQTEVLAHPNVMAFWTHGGYGANHGLHFGKPLLVTPDSWETRDFGVRFANSGAALLVDNIRRVPPAELTARLDRLLTEDGFRSRAEYWQRRFEAAGGVTAAADLVLEHA